MSQRADSIRRKKETGAEQGEAEAEKVKVSKLDMVQIKRPYIDMMVMGEIEAVEFQEKDYAADAEE